MDIPGRGFKSIRTRGDWFMVVKNNSVFTGIVVPEMVPLMGSMGIRGSIIGMSLMLGAPQQGKKKRE